MDPAKSALAESSFRCLGRRYSLFSNIAAFTLSSLNYGFYEMELQLLAASMLIFLLPFAVGLGLVVVGRRAGSAILGTMGLLIVVFPVTWETGASDALGWLMSAAVVVSGLLLLSGAVATLRTGKQ